MKDQRQYSRMFLMALAVAWMASPCVFAQSMKALKVVLIGVDGLSPDGIRNAETPTLDALMERGAHTMNARAVMPTSSSPNWASMIMGAGPEQHGITSNSWELDEHEIPPIAIGPGGMFPTIFSVLRARHPSENIMCFYDWGGFGRLFEHEACTVFEHTPGPEKTIERATKFISDNRPLFTFIHLDHVDHAGHDSGHGTPAYYAAVEEADRYIGKIVEALRNANMTNEAVVIVTSDHGGKGKGHGGASLAEMEIPWIAAGPSIKRGAVIETPVMTWDTAATVAYILGATPPASWIAKPVLAAFED